MGQPRRSGLVALVAAALVASACTRTPVAVPTSLPAPTGNVTFYLSLPGSTAALLQAAGQAASPGSGQYRHFSSLTGAAERFGATAAQIKAVAESIKSLGLQFAADPTRLFGRVTGTTAQWQAALGTPLLEQAATAASPFITYGLPQQLPAALQPSGTGLIIPQAQVYVAGDAGSTTCGTNLDRTTLSYPAVAPFVTAVGGTRLALGAGNSRVSETVWNDSVYGQNAAGGGGISVPRRTSTQRSPR